MSDVEVTREHRLLALRALCVPQVLEQLGPKTKAWVDFGHEHSRHDPAATLVAKAIANAEARGRESSSAQVTSLKAELADLRSQAIEAPAPTVAMADRAGLAADWAILKSTYVIGAKGCDETCTVKNCVVERIAAALGVKEPT